MDDGIRQFNKTRIAPTPSGFLHLGNAYSFALTAILAEKTGAKILLRIDDLDRNRVNKEYVQDIFDTLNFLEIPWHEGPRNMQEYERAYSQIHRIDLYRGALNKLRDNGDIFACSCSRSQIRNNNLEDIYPGTCRDKGISLDAEDVSWRLKTGGMSELSVNTLADGVTKAALPVAMKDFVVRKKDDFPAYQLASVADDLHFGVDLIVRGKDLWDSTLAQLYLAGRLGTGDFQKVTFHHHALLTTRGGDKLSKSAGDTSVHYLRKQGEKPAGIYTRIAGMLGFKEPVHNWRQLGSLIKM